MSESKIIQVPEINDGCQSDQFPIGMQVLAIDANIVSLTYLVALLRKCQYQVTATTKAEEALEYLRQDKEKFDIILIDVVRLDMDGFKLLEIISHETDIPVVMVSINDDQANIMRGISNGAQAFLLKPVRLLEIMNIWQHVVRKNLSASQRSFKVMEQKGPDNPMPFEGDGETMTAREEEADSQSSLNASRTYKKSRLNWTPELHDKFLSAVKQLGGEEEAKPNHILKVMNVPGLTRENIASHLQKHRVNLRKHNGTASEMANNILSGFDSSTRITASQNVASSDECGLHQANQKLIDRPTRMHDDRDLAGSSFPLMVRYPTSNFHPNKQIIDPQEIAMNVPPLMMSGHGQIHQMNIMHNIHGQEIIPFARKPPMENHFLMQEFELPSTFHPRGIWQNVSLPGIVSYFPSTTNVTTQDIHRRHHHQGGTNNYDEVLFSYPSQMILKDDSAGQKNAISQSASRVPFVSNPNSQMQGPVINMGSRREEETEIGMQLLKIDQFLTAPSDDFQE